MKNIHFLFESSVSPVMLGLETAYCLMVLLQVNWGEEVCLLEKEVLI